MDIFELLEAKYNDPKLYKFVHNELKNNKYYCWLRAQVVGAEEENIHTFFSTVLIDLLMKNQTNPIEVDDNDEWELGKHEWLRRLEKSVKIGATGHMLEEIMDNDLHRIFTFRIQNFVDILDEDKNIISVNQ